MKILSQDQLAELLKNEPEFVDKKVRAAVENRVSECLHILQVKLPGKPSIEIPEIKYDLKGNTAGEANSELIRLNIELLNSDDYFEDMIYNTVPHEFAHTVCGQLYNNAAAHGYKWAWLMGLMGLEPKRTHSYVTKPARVHQKYPLYCTGCGDRWDVTNRVLDRMTRGTKYYCRRCGGQFRVKGVNK